MYSCTFITLEISINIFTSQNPRTELNVTLKLIYEYVTYLLFADTDTMIHWDVVVNTFAAGKNQGKCH